MSDPSKREVTVELTRQQRIGLALQVGRIRIILEGAERVLDKQCPVEAHPITMTERDWDLVIQQKHLMENDNAQEACDIIENYLTD